MRHGKGVYTLSDGTRYDGMWVEDRKQGQGELFLPSKEVIRCSWENDRINGEGYITDAKGNRTQAIWYYDMMVPKGNQTTRCCDCVPLSIFWTLSAITMIILGYLINGYCLIAVPILWLINCFESCCCSKTLKYTEHPMPLRLIDASINKMKRTRMRIVFHIQNYHYETRIETYTDGNGNT